MQDEIAAAARAQGIPYSVSIATAFGCSFEGEVPRERLGALADDDITVQ